MHTYMFIFIYRRFSSSLLFVYVYGDAYRISKICKNQEQKLMRKEELLKRTCTEC